MRTLEFTEDQMKNLAVFLNRVQLTGAEVPAYLEIVQAINKPVLDMVANSQELKKDDKIDKT
jgi:hypothetical protein